ncbi:hypothetical protein H5S09_02940 [Limosilactobacillus sp. STM2_1]|uniref:Lipoprotein n=1 Tax=Limosilactobacillus rudii TaxID=2759755 RepID=A0A7W3UJW4_9LACO|nr:hypothetical protein [Limosilactobacillus rudii]MBB1078311.1 hypothetical protein [Limosilactobacillus rudii]MBB1096907.1 hypothetical protein [Limosilactobacillus rudii]MCD7134093.1 hypothetical protein [Limosilactobacillus rudii]
MRKHKLVLIGATSLLCLTLGACGNQKNETSQSTSEAREANSLKKDNAKLKKQIAKDEKNKDKDEIATSSSSDQINQLQESSQANTPQASSAVSQQSAGKSSSIDNFNGDIHDFVNTYGETMTAYKIDHGMSPQDALASTPDDMKTSGELQDQYMMNGGQ